MEGPFAVVSRRTLTPRGLEPGAVLVRGGRIAGLCGPGEVPREYAVEDAGDALLLPGAVDAHVHVNEPGRTEWEGFQTATRAAAAGGVTTILDMPLNSLPPVVSAAALGAKRAAADGRLWVDCGFWGGVVPGNSEELEPLAEAGAFGFKCFLIDSGVPEFPPAAESDLREAMPVLARLGLPLLAHAELCGPGAAPDGEKDPRSYAAYLASRPGHWETAAIELLLRLSRETGCRVHVVHLSCADALPLIARAKEEGLPVTAETCPHYLTFDAGAVPDGATAFKCAPPIRGRENRERLWTALKEGVIDFIASDHSPCVPELKRLKDGDFTRAWGGIASLQLLTSAVWTEAGRRGFRAEDIVRWLCAAPAAFAGLASKGTLAPGKDADLVAWDPDTEAPVEPERLLHRHKTTPYAGRRLKGAARRTWLRGRTVFEDGRIGAAPRGRALSAKEAAHVG